MSAIVSLFYVAATALFAWLIFVICRNEIKRSGSYLNGLAKDISISLAAGITYAYIFAVAFNLLSS